MSLDKNQIAQRIAQELQQNMYVNLGIGIPTLVANYIPKDIDIEFQSENGVLGMGPFPYEGEEDPDLINAGRQTITTLPGAVLFDSATSFAPWRVYNIGNNSPVELMDYIKAIESALGIVAKKELLPLQLGDVPDTYADVDDLVREFDYKPSMTVTQGVKNFVDWYKEYHKL